MQRISKFLWDMIEKIALFPLKLLFLIIEKELTDTATAAFIQFVKFGIVGLSNTILSYVIYAVSLLLFRNMNILPGTDYFVSHILAFVLSVLWSFYWNNRMVFTLEEGEERSILKTLLRTFAAYSVTGLFLNSMLLVLCVQFLHISEFLAPIINLVISVPVNFMINKFWAFRKQYN